MGNRFGLVILRVLGRHHDNQGRRRVFYEPADTGAKRPAVDFLAGVFFGRVPGCRIAVRYLLLIRHAGDRTIGPLPPKSNLKNA